MSRAKCVARRRTPKRAKKKGRRQRSKAAMAVAVRTGEIFLGDDQPHHEPQAPSSWQCLQ